MKTNYFYEGKKANKYFGFLFSFSSWILLYPWICLPYLVFHIFLSAVFAEEPLSEDQKQWWQGAEGWCNLFLWCSSHASHSYENQKSTLHRVHHWHYGETVVFTLHLGGSFHQGSARTLQSGLDIILLIICAFGLKEILALTWGDAFPEFSFLLLLKYYCIIRIFLSSKCVTVVTFLSFSIEINLSFIRLLILHLSS